MDTVDLRAREVARRQYGRATRRQLTATAGISRATIGRRVKAGVWTEPLPGVIDLGTHADSWRARLQEAVLAAGADAWASHHSAGHLHRFLDLRRPDDLDVLVLRDRRRNIGTHRVHTTLSLGVDEVTEVHGLPCTTKARTLLDLAATALPDELERWLADLLRKDREVMADLRGLLDRHRAALGRRRLLDVVARLPEGVELLGSPLEVLAVQELVRLGAPEFVLQYTVRDAAGARIKRVDVAWPESRTILELDGAAYHDLAAAKAHDEQVRARLRALGWRVVVIRRADIGGELLRRLVCDLRDAAA